MSKALLNVAGALGACAILAGCGPHQTVDWYTAHPTERADKVAWCVADAARQADADCLNAIKSRDLARFSPSAPATNSAPVVRASSEAAAGSASTTGEASPVAPRHVGSPGAKPTEFHYKKPASTGGN